METLDKPASLPAAAARSSPKTLVLGLGNPLLSDDGVGLHVVTALRRRLAGRLDIELDKEYCGGLRLMERLIGCDRAIVIDAICSGATPGTIRVLSPDEGATRHSSSAHDADLGTALAVGRRNGAALPASENIRLVAVEAGDVLTFGEACTPQVQACVEQAAETVVAILSNWRHEQ
jgi:hydrogenase maturation protease